MGRAGQDTTEQDPRGVVAAVRLDAAGVLDLWDLGAGLDRAERASAVLGLALPGRSRSELGGLTLGQRDRLLFGLLGADESSRIEGVIDCPACGEPVELSISCAHLMDVEPPAEPEPFELGGWRIRWRLPTGDDLVAACGLDAAADPAAFLFARCVLDVQGPTGAATVLDIPDTVRAGLVACIDAWDPLSDIRLEAECPGCGAPESVDLDIATVVWTEIETRAQMLLREIHILARTYGWTESDVLALSTRRRRAYVGLADG
jgi:hypothetical protein